MLSSDFAVAFSNLPNIESVFRGVFSADKLPRNLKKCNFAIINTDVSSGPGLHWYAIIRYSSSILEVFDSLGIDTSKRAFLNDNINFRGIKEIKFNTTQFQKNDTDSCGKFAIYFIVNRLYNLDHSFKEVLSELFIADLETNEQRVESFYQDILNL